MIEFRRIAVAALRIATKGTGRGGVQWHPAGLAELSFGNVEALLIAVEMLQVQVERLPDPDSRGVEESKKCPIRFRAK